MFKALRRNVQQLEGLVSNVLEESADLENRDQHQTTAGELYLWPAVEALTHDLHPVAATASTQLVYQVPDGLPVYADTRARRREAASYRPDPWCWSVHSISRSSMNGRNGFHPIRINVSTGTVRTAFSPRGLSRPSASERIAPSLGSLP